MNAPCRQRLGLLLVAFSLVLVSAFAVAADEPWFAFHQGELIGFKNSRGKVMIAPKFNEIFTVAKRFDHIIAAGDDVGEQSRSYYLLKDGRQIGEDSLYTFDTKPDCESEGSIRFRDKQSGKIGYFDRNGQVMIAAQFDAAEPFRNGVAWVLRDATRFCYDDVAAVECEHYGFKGGQKLLIDRRGEVLVEGFATDNLDTLDWYSLTVGDQPPSDARRVSFKGVNGRYYSFIDIEKEFTAWFAESFLPHLDTASLQANSYHTVWRGVSDQPLNDWVRVRGKSAADYVPALRKHLAALRISGEYGVMLLTRPWPFDAKRNPGYFDGCGNFAYWKTPQVSAMENLNRGVFEPDKHASFDFVRTKNGYRLVSFSLP